MSESLLNKNLPTRIEVLNQFRTPRKSLGDLDVDVVAVAIGMAADIALILDRDGVVRDVAFSADDLPVELFDLWIDRPWIDTVTVESRDKVSELLEEAETGKPTRWRQVNHPTETGIDLPVRYAAVRTSDDRILVMGRDLSAMAALQQRLIEAQSAMEREYAKLRHAETRYRQLFQMGSEAVLIVSASNRRISEANPAAGRLLKQDAKSLEGQSVLDVFASESRDDLSGLLAAVRATGRPESVSARIAVGQAEVAVGASLFRQDGDGHFLVRVSNANGSVLAIGPDDSSRSTLLSAIEKIPDGFVVTDPDLRILAANAAFLDLAQLASVEQALGEPISRWVGRSIDVNVLISNLRKFGSVRQFSTIVNGEFGAQENVDVAAVSVNGGEQPCLGFSIRPARRRLEGLGLEGHDLPRSASQLTELVGRVSLKDLVRETSDVIERLCIETALKLTGDNRASAAEMLGLSRQSLYSKLRRHGLGDLDPLDDR